MFPGAIAGKHLNTMTPYMMMRALGYTLHGFRSSFRTWVNEETTVAREIAEMALSHAVGTIVERSYMRGSGLKRRAELMQMWGDYCCGREANVVALWRAG